MSHSEGILRSGLLLVVLVLSLIMAAQGQPNELSSPASHAEPVAELHPETPTKVPISEPLGAPVPDQTPSEPHIPTSCQPCLAGNFSGSNCTGCPPGLCNSVELCTPCAAGQFSAGNGTVKCGACEPGTFSSEPGSTKCNRCLVSFYCPESPNGLADPIPCPAGFRCVERGLSLPTACNAGFYCPQSRMITQILCPAGHYCPQSGTIIPTPCPVNHFCPAGSISPESCGPLYKSKSYSTKCVPAPSFFVIIFGTILLILSIAAGIFIFRNRWLNDPGENRISTKRTKPASDRSRLLMDSEDDGGYHGT